MELVCSRLRIAQRRQAAKQKLKPAGAASVLYILYHIEFRRGSTAVASRSDV